MEEEPQSLPIFTARLPISKIKRICKLDADSMSFSSEAVQLIGMATERFIAIFANAAYGQAALVKRRTIQVKDVEKCIRTNAIFEFLDGTIDGWPEMSTTQRKGKSQASEEQKSNLSISHEDANDEVAAQEKYLDATDEEKNQIEVASSLDVYTAKVGSDL